MESNQFNPQKNNQMEKKAVKWWVFILFFILAFIAMMVPVFLSQFFSIYGQAKKGTYVFEEELKREPPFQPEEFMSPTSSCMGAENPKLTIVEFGDFNCSKCADSHEIIKNIMQEYGEVVRFCWRNMAILSESSLSMAMAGVCAEKQGKFWEVHDAFLRARGTFFDEDQFFQAIFDQGVDQSKFEVCMKHKLTEAEIKKDYFAWRDLNLMGTPTFFVNGHKLEGVIPLDIWQKLIPYFVSVYDQKNPN